MLVLLFFFTTKFFFQKAIVLFSKFISIKCILKCNFYNLQYNYYNFRSLNRLTRQGNVNHEDISQIQATSLTFSEAKINLEEYEANTDVRSDTDIRTEIIINDHDVNKEVKSANDIREESILDCNEFIKGCNIKDTRRSFSEETPVLRAKILTDDRRTISQPNTTTVCTLLLIFNIIHAFF